MAFFVDETKKIFVTRIKLAKIYGITTSTISAKLDKCIFLNGLDSNGQKTTLYAYGQAKEMLAPILELPSADPKTGIYIDDNGEEWISFGGIRKLYKDQKKMSIGNRLKDIKNYIQGKQKGREVRLYNKAEVLQALDDFFSLPKVEPGTSTYTDKNGKKWIVNSKYRSKYGMSDDLFSSYVEGVPTIPGRDALGAKTVLYELDELEKRFKSILNLPKVDLESPIYTDDNGEEWATREYFKKLSSTSFRFLSQVRKIRGRSSSKINCWLYNKKMMMELIAPDITRRSEEIKKNNSIKEFKDEINDNKIDNLFRLFGTASHSDILLLLDNKEYESISVEERIKIIGEYLGDVNLQPPRLGELFQHEYIDLFRRVDELEPETQSRMAEALLETVIKKGLVELYSSERQDDLEFRIKALTYLEDLNRKSDSSFLHQVLDKTREYLDSIYGYQPPENIVSRLNGDERSFPDFNQKINISEIIPKRRMLIADSMGMGKSASVIMARETLKESGFNGPTLLLAPSNIIELGSWQTYLSSQKDENGKQIGYFKSGMEPKVLVIKSPKDLEEDFTQFDYVIMSQERLDDEIYINHLETIDFDMLIVDEMHKLKKVNGSRSNNLLRLSERITNENKYCVLLSGTPVPNKVQDIAMNIKMLRSDIPEIRDASVQEVAKQIIHGSKDLIRLSQIRGYFMGHMQRKSLPESIVGHEKYERDVHVRMSNEEETLYKLILEDDDLTSSEKLRNLRLLLLNPSLLDPSLEIKGTRVQALEQSILNQFERGKRKIVVFVNDYIEGVIRGEETLIEQLDLGGDVSIESIHGEVSGDERRRIQGEINQGEGKTVVFLSGRTSDVGIDLSGADTVFEYNDPWSIYDKNQQIGRVYRPGLRRDIEVFTFLSTTENSNDEDTIDQGIRRYILAKERAIEKLLNGVPLSDIEQRLIEKEDNTPDEGEVGKTEAEVTNLMRYLTSSNKELNKIFAGTRGRGEQWFTDEVVNTEWGERYAELYSLCGSRAYHPNCNRLEGTLIDIMAREKHIQPEEALILDLASGPEMLRRHIKDGYRGDSVLSIDINPKHFENGMGPYHIGGYLNLPESLKGKCDFVNFSLAMHYAKTDEIPQILSEINKVLKIGGVALINLPYSRQFKDKDKLDDVLSWLGFRVKKEYSGEAKSGNSFSTEMLTIEKTANPDGSPDELMSLFQEEELIDGIKIKVKSANGLRHQNRIIDSISLDEKLISIIFNERDSRIYRNERSLIELGESLKEKYGSIKDVPEQELAHELQELDQGKLIRVRYNGKYVLFGKIEGDEGYITIK